MILLQKWMGLNGGAYRNRETASTKVLEVKIECRKKFVNSHSQAGNEGIAMADVREVGQISDGK